MLVSVFTPSHDPRWLDEAYRSLVAQTYEPWEWVLVLNRGAATGESGRVADAIRADPRVRVVRAPDYADNGKIGTLKRFAVSQCRGSVLAELDHDDWLHPEALERVVAAIGGGAGFVYSDFVQVRHDGSSAVFPEEHGWERYGVEVGDASYVALRAFPATPASLTHIWWAPNHIRAWTRDAYDRAGGHDPNLRVCDDLDLVCRTYLAGVEFAHVPAALYFYRVRTKAARNTHLTANAEIQKVDQEISNRHFYGLVDEWCRREGLAIVHADGPAGTGDQADGTAGLVRAYDVLHRVPSADVPAVMNEFYRVLAPGGWLSIRVPSASGPLALADPTARSFWNRCSWWFYTRAIYAAQVPGLAVRFQECRTWEEPRNHWERQHRVPSCYADLCALKGQRQPGSCHI
jgi:O-antigen biosynthesis protein